MSLSKNDLKNIADLLNEQEHRLSGRIDDLHKDLKESKKDINDMKDTLAYLSRFVDDELKSTTDHLDRNDKRLDVLESKLLIQ